jgi:hypothetical protein
MLKIVDLEVDENDHPLYPPKIKRTEVTTLMTGTVPYF